MTRSLLFWTLVAALAVPATALAQSAGNRLLGLDVSRWQGDISPTTWTNFRTVENRQFVFIRASRGGTTGEDHLRGGYPANDDTFFSLSQRYDDPYFIQNITRAAAAGMYAGSYHFSRPDIIATTANANGIANTGVDEANHFIQMAGAFMRPGYLPPVHDLEAGDGFRTDNEIAQFTLDFSNRIYQVMGIRPAIYLNGNYAQGILAGASLANRNLLAQPSATAPNPAGPAYTQVWSARWPNPANPNAIDVQNGHPKDSFSTIYGPWDDYGTTHPWTFWQYASTGRLTSFNNGASDLDFNVVHGGFDYLKDQLIPALWMNDISGDWSTLANWNSGQTPVAPPLAAGQLTPPVTGPLPTPRLPGAAGTGPTAGSNDTVILDRPSANITVTLSAGTHNIRKLYVRETLLITGGSLTVNYVPVAESTPMAAQFSAPVSISGGAAFSVHTLFVDPAFDFTAGNANLTFDTFTLMRGATPARLVLNGNVTVNGLFGGTAKIGTNTGSAATGTIDLATGNRTITVTNGAATNDLEITVPIANGTLNKSGPGTLVLAAASTYAGTTTINAGTLLATNTTGSATGPGGQVSVMTGGTLRGGNISATSGLVTGPVTVFAGGTIAPGEFVGTLSVAAATLAGTLEFEMIAPGPSAATGTGGSTNTALHDQLKVTGNTFALTAGAVVKVVEIGGMTGFNAAHPYSWTLATTLAGTPTVNATATIDTSLAPVLAAAGGTLSLSVNGTVVNLNYTPAPVPEPAVLTLALFAGALALVRHGPAHSFIARVDP